MSDKPLALDLCSGLGGWAEGLEAEGWDVIRVDIADMFSQTGTPKPQGCLLMLQDIRAFHGFQARQCKLIVASPPCTEFSWMAMPWSRAKHVARALRGEGEFPENYRGSRTIEQLTALFDACFRIQREACEAAGRHIPLVVENVRGAQPWVGRARARYGSFFLWGDVPALMPMTKRHIKVAGFRFDGSGKSFQSASVARNPVHEGVKQRGSGAVWFDTGICKSGSKSNARKAASAIIARIPFELARYIAATFKPEARK